jgi:tetratricopeptide (TPR) repeat protein
MSPSTDPLFPSRGERGYLAAFETFPWPVVTGYEDMHRWMDQDQAVHAAWQLKDVWEGLLKFLATLAVADHMATAPSDDPRTRKLLDQLLKKGGLTDGDWAKLMEIALKDGPLTGTRLPQHGPVLFQGGKRQRLYRLFISDKDDFNHDDFISWRNSCFGHGVFRKDLRSYAREALHWLGRLHEAFDLCRALLTSMALEWDGPNDEPLTWEKSPLPFYHGHQPAANDPLLRPVRVRTPAGELQLTPILSVQVCVVCGNWTAFYLDKYDREKHRAQFLDFIEGHSNDHKDLDSLLRTWTTQIKVAKAPNTATPKLDSDERREPDPEYFRDFQHEFEPPAYLARQAADFLRAHDRGVLALTGPGGVGKSWATQGLDHAGMLPAQLGRAVPLLTVSMHGPTAPRASDVRTALDEYARREKRWQVPAWPDGPDPHTRFAAWLAALMRANGLGELLVALDGLDDLPADSDVPDLWPPAGKLPPGCYLVLSSRPGVRAAAESGLRRVRSMPDHFCELRVGADEPEHRVVLRSYVAKRLARPRPDGQGALPATWAEPLIDQAGGSFLYVFHYCRALHFGVYDDLTQLPTPAAYYPAFFAHLRGRVGDELFHGHYARTLAFLAVAREPVGLTHLEAWGLKRSSLIDILADLADLLRTRREPWDDETLYGLGHDAIRQFLAEDSYWQSRLAAANRDLAKQAVRRFEKDWSAVDPFDPVKRYLLFHLLDHATEPELRERLLADTTLADACLEHGFALSNRRAFAASLLAYGMALNLRQDQVQRQGRPELRHELARSYVNLSIDLTQLGRMEETLVDYAAAIGLYEELVREGRRELREYLAWTYMNRGITLADLGRLEEALADHDRAIGLYEELVHHEGCRELRHELAMAHLNRGIPLGELGRLEEAMVDYVASTSLFAELVQREGRHELRHPLAKAYMNWGVVLRKLGRLEEALADYGTCIGLYEDLVREGHHEVRNSLAMTYTNQGVTLRRLGRMEEARAAYGAAISLYEELVRREGRRELRDDLAWTYTNRGVILADLGLLDEALTDFGAAISLREELVNREGRRELAGELGTGYARRAELLLRMGRREEACQRAREAMSILQSEVTRTGRADLRGVLELAEEVTRNACD